MDATGLQPRRARPRAEAARSYHRREAEPWWKWVGGATAHKYSTAFVAMTLSTNNQLINQRMNEGLALAACDLPAPRNTPPIIGRTWGVSGCMG